MKICKVTDPGFDRMLEKIARRSVADIEEIEARVRGIIEDVRKRGDTAVLEYTHRFDGVSLRPEEIGVTKAEVENATEFVDADIRVTLEKAASRIKKFHTLQLQKSWMEIENGIILGQLYRPVETAGVYAPGGKAPYPSSVLMGAIPAKIAGVENIYMVSPPASDKTLNPYLIVAAHICGVNGIFRMGGAQAIAALAYGTETVPRVDKIVGPGNIYVALAKKIVFGDVDIDMIAGPSEIVVISDGKVEAGWIAADLLSQAEHDEMASSVLLTTDAEFAQNVLSQLELQLEQLTRKKIARASLDSFGVILVCRTIDEAIDIANMIAPEHLELCVESPWQYLSRIKNAGAIFVGRYTPEPLGDYAAGPNHVLPTGGTARFASPLGVEDFQKRISLLHFSKDGFGQLAEDVEKFADAEGLTAHKRSISIRRNS